MRKLTEKDIKEGKELMEMIEKLPESEKIQVRIYTQALADRGEITKAELSTNCRTRFEHILE